MKKKIILPLISAAFLNASPVSVLAQEGDLVKPLGHTEQAKQTKENLLKLIRTQMSQTMIVSKALNQMVKGRDGSAEHDTKIAFMKLVIFTDYGRVLARILPEATKLGFHIQMDQAQKKEMVVQEKAMAEQEEIKVKDLATSLVDLMNQKSQTNDPRLIDQEIAIRKVEAQEIIRSMQDHKARAKTYSDLVEQYEVDRRNLDLLEHRLHGLGRIAMLKIPRIVEEIKDGAFGTTSIPLKESRSAIQEMTTLLEGMRFNEMDPQYPEGKDVIRDHGQPLSNDLARIAVPQTPEGIALAEYIKKARVSRN